MTARGSFPLSIARFSFLGPLQRGEVKRWRAQVIGYAPISERKTALRAIAVELIIVGGFLLNAPAEAT
jgi:hypothetical protein